MERSMPLLGLLVLLLAHTGAAHSDMSNSRMVPPHGGGGIRCSALYAP